MQVYKLFSLGLLICFFSSKVNSQFYYSDILSTKKTNETYLELKKNKVQKITATNSTKNILDESIIAIVQTFSKDWNTVKTTSNPENGVKYASTTYYVNNKIQKKWDEGKNVNSLLRYSYNSNNNVTSIIASSIDTTVFDGFFETHLFYYDNTGLPTKMLKIKNQEDTTFINFLKDEQGNIAEEIWKRNNEIIETYYYYYNEKKLLTDIVKFNLKVQKMLPEFLFEYDENGNNNKMTQIPFGTSNYVVWHYLFNENKLKQAAFCYSKKGELLNQMEYKYEYNLND